ncbi:DUF4974 domain-containing protein [Sphingobacterium sp. DK4209]|uniref:DUF4974 domain-containing protein n=1 Tax=Sphingobacterium zhuxiongii TaxID=2662364 RepID=A0A5Q0QF53_9SPHI|nr:MULTISPECIES: FecR family protein [unclassified Sphingobacterium]MVZ65320.1 DUF4974 domain-containing protein [Sphingobacterium sp. DK4209]QGA26408.1 DUF4974 domain-containing protein [Sphingobacterium sp. dk4302]
MNHQSLKNQLLRYLHNELQADEITHLFQELEQLTASEIAELIDEESVRSIFLADHLQVHRKEAVKADLLQRMAQEQTDSSPLLSRSRFKWSWIAAAAVLIAASFSGYLWYTQDKSEGRGVEQMALQQDISLNEQPPEVRFADGRVLALDTNKQYSQEAITFSMNADGLVNYHGSDKQHHEELLFSSPKGRISQIELSDGTRVWLNSGSSIRFSPFFAGNQRDVKLDGEAYFEVSKNPKKPFIVHSSLSKVKVLGTAFNVSSYASTIHKITLLHGSIALETKAKSMILKPETQAEVNANGSFAVSAANMDEVMAWKNGDFVFNEIDLNGLMAQLKKWYDIEEVIVEGKSTDRFTGSLTRSKQLSQLLKALEVISNCKFSIVERRVYVKVI